VWGDGGIATTDSEALGGQVASAAQTHGLMNRDECAVFAYNSRLDTVQAEVAAPPAAEA